MERGGAVAGALGWLSRTNHEREGIRSVRHARAFRRRVRSHAVEIRGLVEEAGAHPSDLATRWPAGSACEHSSRCGGFSHRARHSPRRGNDCDDPPATGTTIETPTGTSVERDYATFVSKYSIR